MLTRILHNSEQLCAFLDSLDLELYQPQRRHLLNMADALLVCEEEKTLAALQRQFVSAPDASNMADFLRISPWRADWLRDGLRCKQVSWLLREAERTDAPRQIYINLDDSLGAKDKATTKIEPVAWHFDHTESRKGHPRYKNGICFLACTLRIGEHVATVDLRLYLREKTVRRLNRKRTAEKRIPFRSKNSLARMILEALKPLLPPGWQVKVQFDSWYASKRLIKYVLRQGWHVTCALKYNRLLNDVSLDKHAQAIRHRHYTRVRVTATDNQKTTYFVRRLEGRLADIPYDVRVFFSKWHPRAKSQAYILCTDLSCSAKTALQGYCWALVLRSRQLLYQNSTRTDRFPSSVLRGGGQIHACRPFGVGLCRISFRNGTFGPNPHLWRHYPASSRRTCHRVVGRRYPNGYRYRRPTSRDRALSPTSFEQPVVSDFRHALIPVEVRFFIQLRLISARPSICAFRRFLLGRSIIFASVQ